jgi:hypothetical protein
MITDIDAIRRRSTPSRKNAEHDVFGSPCGLSVEVEAEAHIFDSNGNKLLAVGRVERPPRQGAAQGGQQQRVRHRAHEGDERGQAAEGEGARGGPIDYKLATELNYTHIMHSLISTTRSQ